MGVDGGIASSTSEGEVLCLGDVHPGFGLAELLGESKVYNMNQAPLRTLTPNSEVLWFDIPVDVVVCVHKFNPSQL